MTPTDIEALVKEARIAGKQRDWRRATALLRQAVQLAPFRQDLREMLAASIEHGIGESPAPATPPLSNRDAARPSRPLHIGPQPPRPEPRRAEPVSYEPEPDPEPEDVPVYEPVYKPEDDPELRVPPLAGPLGMAASADAENEDDEEADEVEPDEPPAPRLHRTSMRWADLPDDELVPPEPPTPEAPPAPRPSMPRPTASPSAPPAASRPTINLGPAAAPRLAQPRPSTPQAAVTRPATHVSPPHHVDEHPDPARTSGPLFGTARSAAAREAMLREPVRRGRQGGGVLRPAGSPSAGPSAAAPSSSGPAHSFNRAHSSRALTQDPRRVDQYARRHRRGPFSAMLMGGLAAVVLVALVAAGGWFYLQHTQNSAARAELAVQARNSNLMARAREYSQRGEMSKALEQLEQLPPGPVRERALAAAYMDSGDRNLAATPPRREAALEAYLQAVRYGGGEPQYGVPLGRVYYQLAVEKGSTTREGREFLDLARATFERVLERDAANVEALQELAKVAIVQRDDKLLAESYRRIMRADPDSEAARDARNNLQARGFRIED